MALILDENIVIFIYRVDLLINHYVHIIIVLAVHPSGGVRCFTIQYC